MASPEDSEPEEGEIAESPGVAFSGFETHVSSEDTTLFPQTVSSPQKPSLMNESVDALPPLTESSPQQPPLKVASEYGLYTDLVKVQISQAESPSRYTTASEGSAASENELGGADSKAKSPLEREHTRVGGANSEAKSPGLERKDDEKEEGELEEGEIEDEAGDVGAVEWTPLIEPASSQGLSQQGSQFPTNRKSSLSPQRRSAGGFSERELRRDRLRYESSRRSSERSPNHRGVSKRSSSRERGRRDARGRSKERSLERRRSRERRPERKDWLEQTTSRERRLEWRQSIRERDSSKERRPERKKSRERNEKSRREEDLQEAESLAEKVTVEEAQKSLVGVCKTLESAFELLLEATDEGQQLDMEAVPRVAESIFLAMRKAYIVATTGTGRNKETKAAVLSTIEKAHEYRSRIFFPKQSKEIEQWLSALTPKDAPKMVPSSPQWKSEEPTPFETPLPFEEPPPKAAPKVVPAFAFASPSKKPQLDALSKAAQAYAQGLPQQAEPVQETRPTISIPNLVTSAELALPLSQAFSAQYALDPAAPPGFDIASEPANSSFSQQPGLLIEEPFSDLSEEDEPPKFASVKPSSRNFQALPQSFDLPPGFGVPATTAETGPPWIAEAPIQHQGGLSSLTEARKPTPPLSVFSLQEEDKLPDMDIDPPGFATTLSRPEAPSLLEEPTTQLLITATERPSTAISEPQPLLSVPSSMPPGFEEAKRALQFILRPLFQTSAVLKPEVLAVDSKNAGSNTTEALKASEPAAVAATATDSEAPGFERSSDLAPAPGFSHDSKISGATAQMGKQESDGKNRGLEGKRKRESLDEGAEKEAKQSRSEGMGTARKVKERLMNGKWDRREEEKKLRNGRFEKDKTREQKVSGEEGMEKRKVQDLKDGKAGYKDSEKKELPSSEDANTRQVTELQAPEVALVEGKIQEEKRSDNPDGQQIVKGEGLNLQNDAKAEVQKDVDLISLKKAKSDVQKRLDAELLRRIEAVRTRQSLDEEKKEHVPEEKQMRDIRGKEKERSHVSGKARGHVPEKEGRHSPERRQRRDSDRGHVPEARRKVVLEKGHIPEREKGRGDLRRDLPERRGNLDSKRPRGRHLSERGSPREDRERERRPIERRTDSSRAERRVESSERNGDRSSQRDGLDSERRSKQVGTKPSELKDGRGESRGTTNGHEKQEQKGRDQKERSRQSSSQKQEMPAAKEESTSQSKKEPPLVPSKPETNSPAKSASKAGADLKTSKGGIQETSGQVMSTLEQLKEGQTASKPLLLRESTAETFADSIRGPEIQPLQPPSEQEKARDQKSNSSLPSPSPAGSRSASPLPSRPASPALSNSQTAGNRKVNGLSNLGRPPKHPVLLESREKRLEGPKEGIKRMEGSVQASADSQSGAQTLSTADSMEREMLGVLLKESEGEKGQSEGGKGIALRKQGSSGMAHSNGDSMALSDIRPGSKVDVQSPGLQSSGAEADKEEGDRQRLAEAGSNRKRPVEQAIGKVSKVAGDSSEQPPSSKKPRQETNSASKASPAGSSGDPQLDALLENLSADERTAVEKERVRRLGEQERMLEAKKLCLVLDLDHTLLNSAMFSDIEKAGSQWAPKLQAKLAHEKAACRADPKRPKELFCFPDMQMWTKLRPGVLAFLKKASQLYELHVYTMGNKTYATRMAQILDPTGDYFAGRIISKGDSVESTSSSPGEPPAQLKSKDLDGVLGMESSVLIIDDSAKVWPHHFHNLIVVERYMYFPGSRQQFGLSGPSLFEDSRDERADVGMLASAARVVEQVHREFFRELAAHKSADSVDAREILRRIQKSILQGVRIVFSRVYPQGTARPEQHTLWRMAEHFGASCTATLDDSVTHVVASALGTDKVNWAIKAGRHAVTHHWLEASAILYQRAHESQFSLLPPQPKEATPKPQALER